MKALLYSQFSVWVCKRCKICWLDICMAHDIQHLDDWPIADSFLPSFWPRVSHYALTPDRHCVVNPKEHDASNFPFFSWIVNVSNVSVQCQCFIFPFRLDKQVSRFFMGNDMPFSFMCLSNFRANHQCLVTTRRALPCRLFRVLIGFWSVEMSGKSAPCFFPLLEALLQPWDRYTDLQNDDWMLCLLCLLCRRSGTGWNWPQLCHCCSGTSQRQTMTSSAQGAVGQLPCWDRLGLGVVALFFFTSSSI